MREWALKWAQIQVRSLETCEGVISLEEGEVATHICEVSNGSCTISAEKDHLTPVLETGSFVPCEAIEVVLSFDEDLVEAQNSWNVGKSLRLKSSTPGFESLIECSFKGDGPKAIEVNSEVNRTIQCESLGTFSEESEWEEARRAWELGRA